MNNRKILFVDIETVGNPDMCPFVETPVPPTPEEAPRNFKKEEAIKGWMAKETKRREAEYQERLERMPLDVDFARVIAIGYVIGNAPIQVALAEDTNSEAAALLAFWTALKEGSRICGFNVLDYDLPIILRRSWMLGVRPTRMLDFRRYSTQSVIDLMQILYNWGKAPGPRYRGLKKVCEMFGIPNPLPELDGSQVAEMDTATRAKYCKNDVEMTRELARRTYGWYWGWR